MITPLLSNLGNRVTHCFQKEKKKKRTQEGISYSHSKAWHFLDALDLSKVRLRRKYGGTSRLEHFLASYQNLRLTFEMHETLLH